MEAKELMIGDWVNIPQANVGLRKIDVGDISFFTEFEPIPLTPEILEKNGFTKTGNLYHQSKDGVSILDGQYWELQGPRQVRDYYRVSVNLENTEYKGKFIGITSSLGFLYNTSADMTVNRLQHLMRAFGLTELADSIII